MTGAGPQITFLGDNKRLHLHHGPIDLIVEVWGTERARAGAYQRAAQSFEPLLATLVEELPALRRPITSSRFQGPVAGRMATAVARHEVDFVTPMAAVAGAVADEVLAATLKGPGIEKAYVNNGGDIAFHLGPGQVIDVAVTATQAEGRIRIDYGSPSRGVATSGWRGRSYSLGIADAVTVLAKDAASADVAATLIANAVDLQGPHPSIERHPANEQDPDSDLGDRLVTVAVGPLTDQDVQSALSAGARIARAMQAQNTIDAAFLLLQGRTVQIGNHRTVEGNED